MQAPPSGDGALKYKDWTLAQLKDECNKRKIQFDQKDSEKTLIELLIKNDHKKPDWAEIYADLIQFGIGYFEIPNMTIPAIEAIRTKFFERRPFSMNMGFPGIFGEAPQETPAPINDGKPPKLSQFMEFANMFNGA
jgi:hypothetical protein